jgi:hypothetical protein
LSISLLVVEASGASSMSAPVTALNRAYRW